MAELGYSLLGEEHDPRSLVRHAARAEEAGFRFGMFSDHFHPWLSAQGESPFVWSVLGAAAQVTQSLRLMTGVSCPLGRQHPAIVAQAAATVSQLADGRFWLGLGSGEHLNEHVVDVRWPSAARRLRMLAEAIDVIRALWSGEQVNHHGDFFTVEDARLYTMPLGEPPILVAPAGGESAARLAAANDGLITTEPDPGLVDAFRARGGQGKPCLGQVTVC